MKIILTNTGSECPIADRSRKATKSDSQLPDFHGAFSVQEFPYTNNLDNTHEDAEGFIDYLEKWHPKNFWFKDSNVRNWAFYEENDNYEDTYGIDAVLACYFSSHGSMDSNGNFSACMGSDWANQGHYANSHNMRIGNEQANYVWWSACESMRIFGGHDPIRTWSPACQGFRMMFGYETTSSDSDDYGGDFWDQWNEGKSLSKAFLDTSWDISSDQIPVVVAVGATYNEAMERLQNERMLEWGHVKPVHWVWGYYEQEKSARRAGNRSVSEAPLIALLTRRTVDGHYVRNILRRHRLEMPLPRQVKANAAGVFYLGERNTRLSFQGDGSYEVEYAAPNLRNQTGINVDKAVSIAEHFIREEGLAQRTDVALERIRLYKVGGGQPDKNVLNEPSIIETTVEFTQMINNTPVISPKYGRLRVSIDNDGKVTRLQNRTREVQEFVRFPTSTSPAPQISSSINGLDTFRQWLEMEWHKQLRIQAALGKEPSTMELVANSFEIGYEVMGNEIRLCARGLIEVTMPGGFRKRYYVIRPIVG